MGLISEKILQQTLISLKSSYGKDDFDRLEKVVRIHDEMLKKQRLNSEAEAFHRDLAVYTLYVLAYLELPIDTMISGFLLDAYLRSPQKSFLEAIERNSKVLFLLNNVTELYAFEMQMPWRTAQSASKFKNTVLEKLRERAIRNDQKQKGSILSSSLQHDNHRKLIVASSKTADALVIKLADRISILKLSKPAAQPPYENLELDAFFKKLAMETLNIHAPIAERLGIWRLKWPLQDFAFRIQNHEEYQKIKEKLAATRERREILLKEIVYGIKTILQKSNIAASVYGRQKNIYSIYRKKTSIEKINDLTGVRVIVNKDKINDCYRVLKILLSTWQPAMNAHNEGIYDNGEVYRDWIATPKTNRYQSIHTTIKYPSVDNQEHLVEVQIRTEKMHKRAEYGIAAHWNYKEKKENGAEKFSKGERHWSQKQEIFHNKISFTKSLPEIAFIELFTGQIFCLTPSGEILRLPAGATPIDFAYHIHGELGHRIIFARVNNKPRPINCKLKDGDIVEIIFSKETEGGGPELRWLSKMNGFAKSGHAFYMMKKWFRQKK